MDREKNQSKGFGYISFDDDASVNNAIKLAGSELDGRQIRVDKANKQ